MEKGTQVGRGGWDIVRTRFILGEAGPDDRRDRVREKLCSVKKVCLALGPRKERANFLMPNG